MLNKKVLVIEDEKPMAHALELKLRSAGFEVAVASNGQDGLELLGTESFDLVLLDLIMSKMDGFKVLEEMRTRNITVPVIVLSNLSQEEDNKKAIALGACECFVKSNITLASVVENVKKTLGL